MVVLDQFYQIIEKDTKKISFFWKVSHVLVFIGAAVCGFLTSYSFGQLLYDFNYYCVLNAKLAFSNTTNLTVNMYEGSGSVTVQAIEVPFTRWGSTSDCQFSQFTPLFTMIAAIVWGAFFIIIARGGAGYERDLMSRPWAIVYPCVIFTVIAFIIYAISTLKLRRGLIGFCKEFQSQFKTEKCVHEIGIYSTQFHSDEDARLGFDFYVNQKMAIVSSEIGIWMWIIQLCLLIARIVQMVDFDLHLVTILPKEEEIIEKITNPEDVDDYEDDETSPV